MDKKVYLSLQDIFADDPLELLNVKPTSVPVTETERLIMSFQEINDFVEKKSREPLKGTDFKERMLASRLEGIRQNEKHLVELLAFDTFGLLEGYTKDVFSFDETDEVTAKTSDKDEVALEKSTEPIDVSFNSIDDILELDPLGLLGAGTSEQLSIFDVRKEITEAKERDKTDFVARRKPCKNFDKYDGAFKQVHTELKSGLRSLVDFKVGTQQPGNYYVHKGVLFLLESFEQTRDDTYKEDGTRVRFDGRTRCIFENGTESNPMWRTIEKMLYDGGKAVTRLDTSVEDELFKKSNLVNEEDVQTGYIYVLKTKSVDPNIMKIPNLHKIGFSTAPVSNRIGNAKKETTYLMSDVHLLMEVACYNLNPNKFERLIHRVFDEVCINLEVADQYGIKHRPKEWFSVPFNVIEDVIDRILDETILEYQYNSMSKSLYRKL